MVYRLNKSNGKLNGLTWSLGDLSKGEDDRLKEIEQLILKLQNLPEQLGLSAYILPTLCHPSISKLLAQPNVTDSLPGKILEPMHTNKDLKATTIAKYMEAE
jgi:hypothetical protein